VGMRVCVRVCQVCVCLCVYQVCELVGHDSGDRIPDIGATGQKRNIPLR